MNTGTFLDLARTWYYAGLPGNIEFTFKNSGAFNEHFMDAFKLHATKAMFTSFLEAEGYFSAMLTKAVVPGVITYTVSGGKSDG
jgi:hypothetical protein